MIDTSRDSASTVAATRDRHYCSAVQRLHYRFYDTVQLTKLGVNGSTILDDVDKGIVSAVYLSTGLSVGGS